MIRLHLFPPCAGVQASYPCAKVETYLTLARLPFERVESWDFRHAPKGKFPFIEDGERAIPDSWFILRYLKRTYGDPLDSTLREHERVSAYALTRMINESLYHALAFLRWFDPMGEPVMREAFFGHLDAAAKKTAAADIKEIIRNQTYYQGCGRHSVDEVYELVETELATLEAALGSKPFLFGEKACTADACLYAYLVGIADGPAPPRLKDAVRQRPRLADFVERMKDELARLS